MSDGAMASEGDDSAAPPYPPGLKGDLAKLFSARGTHQGKPSWRAAARRVLTRPGPLAILLYRGSNRLWRAGHPALAEGVWRVNLLLTGADIHPAAEIGGGLRLTHTSGLVIGRGARLGSDLNVLHGVTIGGSGKRWFDPYFEDGLPEIGDGTEIWAGAKVLGAVKVGRGCHIGANAVVTRDLPDGASYTVGQPLRELRRRVEELEGQVRDLNDRLAAAEAAAMAAAEPTATGSGAVAAPVAPAGEWA
jgi:serine O-acetyltransferase